MIKFEWRGSQQHIEYYINWKMEEEPYQVLFLHYENISKIKRIERGNLKIVDGVEKNVIPVYPSMQCSYKRLPPMPSATYRFELYDNTEKSGKCLATIDLYVGTKMELYREEIPLKDGFSQLKLSCLYKLPGEQCGLVMKEMPEEQFLLPEMKQKEEFYETSCMIVEGTAKHIDVFLGTKIRDFIEIVEKEES